jgi:hypothetical protein
VVDVIGTERLRLPERSDFDAFAEAFGDPAEGDVAQRTRKVTLTTA